MQTVAKVNDVLHKSTPGASIVFGKDRHVTTGCVCNGPAALLLAFVGSNLLARAGWSQPGEISLRFSCA